MQWSEEQIDAQCINNSAKDDSQRTGRLLFHPWPPLGLLLPFIDRLKN